MFWSQWFIFEMLLAIFLCTLQTNSVSIAAPEPFINYNLDHLEIGKLVFLPSTNSLTTGGEYQMITTVTFMKMNKYTPNNFQAYIGWRAIDLLMQTQTQGELMYSSVITSKTSTSMEVKCYMEKVGNFYELIANYLLIHEAVLTSQLIVGVEFHSTSVCLGINSLSTPICTYSVALSVPLTNTRSFLSLKAIKFSRNNNSSRKCAFKFGSSSIVANSFQFDVYFSTGGRITELGVDIFFVSKVLASEKRTFNLQYYNIASASFTGMPLIQYYSFNKNVFDFNFFTALRYIDTIDFHFHYQCLVQTNQTIKSSRFLLASYYKYQSFIFYGHACPDGYYFSNLNSVCQVCPKNCLKCQVNPWDQPECSTCDVNFLISLDKLSCQCLLTPLNSVCQDFNALGLNTCTNALRTATGVQCIFCNPKIFQVASNNQCVCKLGYSDFDKNGICTEICGDNIIFDAECDDGNTNSNDGCSSICTKEAGFVCDYSQSNLCTSQIHLVYKFAFVEKIKNQNKGKITLSLMNTLSSLPFDFSSDNFKSSLLHVKLFIVESESPFNEIEISEVNLQDLKTDKDMVLEFPYTFSVENLKARIEIDYSQTRYINYVQKLEFHLDSLTIPLIFSENIAKYTTISIVLCVGTGLSLICLAIGLCSPKYIGLESLLTLQLVFFSQLLITNPSKWPVGFMYLKYLKLSSGYNELFIFTDFFPETTFAKKMDHLDMKKTFIENFNINFIILGFSFLVFLIFFYLQYRQQSLVLALQSGYQEKLKDMSPLQNNMFSKEIHGEITSRINRVKFLKFIHQKIFWIVNHLSIWMILPIMSSSAANVMIGNSLVEILTFQSSLPQTIIAFGPVIAFSSFLIIIFICMNSFKNIFLSQKTLNKILLKPEEKTYKSFMVIYLFVFGFLILLFNDVVIYKVPMSISIFVLQILYTIALVAVHPYRQSLRVHTVTILINHAVYIVFLAFINLINLVDDIDEFLVIMMGYFITGCCGFLMLLTGVRLYYQLRYGEALEKQIQKEREQEEERQKKLHQEKLKNMKKKLESEAKKKQSQKEIERAQNPFLYENQAKEDEANDVIEWLEKCNWEAEVKEKYFFSKFTHKPLDWLYQNDRSEYEKIVKIKENGKNQKKKDLSIEEAASILKLKQELRKTALQNGEMAKRAQVEHKRKMKTDMNYTMNVMREELNKFVCQGYKLTD